MHADLPTGNTMAIVMVAAEHAAQRIIALDGASSENPVLWISKWNQSHAYKVLNGLLDAILL